jgi:hypothetical protein
VGTMQKDSNIRGDHHSSMSAEHSGSTAGECDLARPVDVTIVEIKPRVTIRPRFRTSDDVDEYEAFDFIDVCSLAFGRLFDLALGA